MEKKVGVVMLEGSDFSELLGVNRLRVQALTLVRNVAQEDLDLTGLTAALENIRAGCPEPEKAPVAPAAPAKSPAPPAEEARPAAECSTAAVARMKAKGLKEKMIAEICGKG